MDLTQAVLLSVIVVLTIFLAVIGFQAFFVLRDLRKTLHKMNRLVDDTDVIVEQVKKPVESARHSFMPIGAAFTYLLTTKNGQKLKETLLKETSKALEKVDEDIEEAKAEFDSAKVKIEKKVEK